MHASVSGYVTCSAQECCQPGTVLVPVAIEGDGEIIELEFCERHVERERS